MIQKDDLNWKENNVNDRQNETPSNNSKKECCKKKKRKVTLELMKREYYKGEENWVQKTELHGPVKLIDEENERCPK